MGAWIETQQKYIYKLLFKSHPTWVRGLKLLAGVAVDAVAPSHPTWVRGLKRTVQESGRRFEGVAPYVGAWIETNVK